MKKNQLLALGIVLLVITFVCGVCCGYLLGNGSGSQIVQTSELQASISTPSSTDTTAEASTSSSETTTAIESETTSNPNIEWLADGYNYLAIGNSITKHDITSYWWNEIGMAASDADHDYFHRVLKKLEEMHGNVMGVACNLYGWEVQSHDRDEALSLLDKYLSPELDLIIVQLGENASDLTTFQSDYLSLLNYIKAKAPNARILVISDFWYNSNRNELKENAAREAGAEYVSLDGITSHEEYYCGLGATVYDRDGNAYIVEHNGVAMHPGDEGMQAIANRIIAVLTME